MVPVFLDKRLFQMIRPNLLILAEIRFPDNIRHPRLDNLKTIFLQVALNLMIRARMKIEEILADDQNARARLAPVIFDRIHPLDRLFKASQSA